MIASRICPIVLVLVPCLLIGCSGHYSTYPAGGKVTYEDGTPLPGGWVEFKSAEHDLRASGTIQEDGTFEMSTYAPGDGAVAGKHHVAVRPGIPTDDSQGGLVADKFQDFDKSGITVTVDSGGENQFTIKVSKE